MSESKFYYVSDDRVQICDDPKRSCSHQHHFFLASAARELSLSYSRGYHLDKNYDVSRCGEKNCSKSIHFSSKKEAVDYHRRNLQLSGVWSPTATPYVSIAESELAGFVSSLGLKVIRNTRDVISPYELDLFLPNEMVAIEFNGSHWHTDESLLERYGLTAEQYHKNKYLLCKERGVELGFVWERNWTQDWITMADAVCELIQFHGQSSILKSFSRAPTPMELHFESVDRLGMEKARARITRKKLREHRR